MVVVIALMFGEHFEVKGAAEMVYSTKQIYDHPLLKTVAFLIIAALVTTTMPLSVFASTPAGGALVKQP